MPIHVHFWILTSKLGLNYKSLRTAVIICTTLIVSCFDFYILAFVALKTGQIVSERDNWCSHVQIW